MDSYDPNFNPATYDPNMPPPTPPADAPPPPPPPGTPDYNDPDMGYIHDTTASNVNPNNDQHDYYDPTNEPGTPGVDAGVYDHDHEAPPPPGDDYYGANDADLYDDHGHGHHEGYGGDEEYHGNDVPQHVYHGHHDQPDEHGNYNDGFDDDDDVYLDNHRNPTVSHEIESTDPKDGLADVFWRNCIMTCTCLFLVTGLIILAVRINEISNEDAQKKEKPYHHSNIALIPPPAALAQKCTHKRVLSEEGFYECEQLCEPADCCNYPTTLALSCLAGHDDECLEYHQHCNVLQLDEAALVNPKPAPTPNIPPAPADIDNKCNMESLRTVPGFEGCVNDCVQAECCWKKDGSVPSCTQLDVCSGYSSCLTMDVTDHVHSDIGKEITQKCADTQLETEVGRNQCIFACSHAACCFDPGTSCPHEDANFCTQYQPCGKIFDASTGQVIQGGSASANAPDIPQAPQFLDTACSRSSLDTLPGWEMCLGACTEAECCWKGKATCLADETTKHSCDGYHHCVTLLDHNQTTTTDAPVADENTIPDAPEYLAAACSSGSLDTSAGFQMCQDACMEAECCWKVTSCSNRPECADYATHCANLVARLDDNDTTGGADNNSDEPFLPEAPHDLDQTCAPAKVLNKGGFDKCQSACDEKAECCWKTGATDSCVSSDQCRAWAPCTVMNGAQDPEAVATQDYSLEQVFDACLNHDNNVGGGSDHKSLCQIVCQSGNCCFDDSKGCPNTMDCKVFEPCQVLHNEKQTQVEAACASGNDLADCVGICATATCCFTNDIQKICDVTNPDVICRQYKACEILYAAEIPSNNP